MTATPVHLASLQAENEAAQVEIQGLQERLEVSEHVVDSLRRELRELGSRQSHTHTELHQARLQVAQLTLQLSEENLLLREERANWALEREAFRHAAEVRLLDMQRPVCPPDIIVSFHFCYFAFLCMQMDKKKFQELSCEVQMKEEWLQEERTEREKLDAELVSERLQPSQVKHSVLQSLLFRAQTHSDLNITAHVPRNPHRRLLRSQFGNGARVQASSHTQAQINRLP